MECPCGFITSFCQPVIGAKDISQKSRSFSLSLSLFLYWDFHRFSYVVALLRVFILHLKKDHMVDADIKKRERESETDQK